MSYRFNIVQGTTRTYPIQVWNQGGVTPARFQLSDTFTCQVSVGQDEPILFNPGVGWWTGLAGDQTGYDQGQLAVTVSQAQSNTLELGGIYQGLILWDQQQAAVGRFSLACEPAPGPAVLLVQPYCTYQDMLFYADWIKMLQRKDVDQEGFYNQRLQARQWMDQLILGQWRGAGLIPFGEPTLPASSWSGATWLRRSSLTSQWLRDSLRGGQFTNPGITIQARGSGYVDPIVTVVPPPGGSGTQQATFGANVDQFGQISSVFVIYQGSGYAPGQVYPLSIVDPSGSGAQVVAQASTGTLILRPEIVQACAFYAIGLVGQSPIGGGQFQSQGSRFMGEAERSVLNITAELDLSGSGLGQLPIPLGGVNSFFT